MLVLLAPGCNLRGQAGRNVIDQGIETIEKTKHPLLLFEWN